MSVATDTDGNVYWKVNGEWLLLDGNKVPATGDKGDKGDTGAAGSAGTAGKDGDSIFKKDGIYLTDPNNVTFTLADGTTKITFPRTGAVKIFDSFDNFKVGNAAADLTLSLNIKDVDYKAIKAELTSSAGLSTAIKTRAAATPWEVAITAPTFKADGTVDAQPVVSITAQDATEGDIALLKVIIVDSKGDEHASTRVLFYSNKVDVESVTIDRTLVLVVNEEQPLTATVLPAGATNKTVTWSSDKTAIATVDANGVVTAVAEGTATITVTTEDGGFAATCEVTVKTDLYLALIGNWTFNAVDAAKGIKVTFAVTIEADGKNGYVFKGFKDDKGYIATIPWTVNYNEAEATLSLRQGITYGKYDFGGTLGEVRICPLDMEGELVPELKGTWNETFDKIEFDPDGIVSSALFDAMSGNYLGY